MRENFQNFLNGYIAAMLWANTYGYDENREFYMANMDREDLSTSALDTLTEQASDFLHPDVEALIEQAGTIVPGYGWDQAGHDFALTRNHHGVGFWDRGLGEVGQALTDYAEAAGEQNLWIDSEDGLVYCE